ncbi:MAG: NAD-dependent epimerase/dehydratase family protein [Clostridium sp.]|nr:NAD-dependent epimerase/dehydratase family protein [Acetatifactor muris]MCM1525815.1 NAD-dependent epimerase/dehydratase family protein [Bacteroides sp.]MCM1564313.1 NAD-dependent epimerase/dehydratase family protein [Clostridium sp.]
MKIGIVGSEGYIAGYLISHYKERDYVEQLLRIDRSDSADRHLDLERPEEFDYDVLDGLDYLIFTAAISGPDACADDFDFCWSVNVTGTQHFIREAIRRQCKVLFFSSDAVFGDIPGAVYTETSKTEAATPYGKMKKAVEDKFKESPFFKAIRLSYVASARDRFVTYCRNCIQRGEEAEVFHPFYRNCIVVSDVVQVVEWMGLHWEDYPFFALNVAGDELVSRVRIADELNRVYGGRLRYKVVLPEERFYQNRPKITQMRSDYLTKYSILKSESFTEKIQREMEGIEI